MDIIVVIVGKDKKKPRQGRANPEISPRTCAVGFLPQPQVAIIYAPATGAGANQFYIGYVRKLYSPMIWQITVLVLGLVSKSTRMICCQVPSVSCPSTIGTANEGPKTEART